MTPEYRINAEKRISEYLNKYDPSKIRYIQVEQTFDDLGEDIHIWNVKTEKESFWVTEGGNTPLNIYTQDAYYFSADEAYSFHMGITQRLQADHHKNFKHVIQELPLDIDRIKTISRMLNIASQEINNITGPEDIQSIALTCRESLVELARALVKGVEIDL